MSQRRLVFLARALVLSGLGVFANWTRGCGALKADLSWAGFPWTFVAWDAGRLERFDAVTFAGDVLLVAAVVIPVAWACA